MTAECVCTPWHDERGLYAADCLVHAHWRCVVTGCMDPASEGHECVLHGRWRRSLSPWGVGADDGAADKECDRYERDVLGL